jgi:large subunit ribosomal protein L24
MRLAGPAAQRALELALQTTLLAVAIAIILALVTALVGPLLIDWGSYRPFFESEASRLIGLPVSVKGEIDARLLPSPQLTLHDIEIGGTGADKARARALDIELALGPLLRGEWRANELRLTGPQVQLTLDTSGHLVAASPAIGFRPDALSIDRLSIVDGKIALTDTAGTTPMTPRSRSTSMSIRAIGPSTWRPRARSRSRPARRASKASSS